MHDKWNKGLRKYAIERGILVVPDEKPDFPYDLPEVDSWSGLMGMLGLIDPKIQDDYMEWILKRDEPSWP